MGSGVGTSGLDELDRTRRVLEQSEDEALFLREELNREKQKVLDIKKAAQKRKEDWKAELGKITEELLEKEKLEKEVIDLKLDWKRLQEKFGRVTETEANVRRDRDRLQRELSEARNDLSRSKNETDSARK